VVIGFCLCLPFKIVKDYDLAMENLGIDFTAYEKQPVTNESIVDMVEYVEGMLEHHRQEKQTLQEGAPTAINEALINALEATLDFYNHISRERLQFEAEWGFDTINMLLELGVDNQRISKIVTEHHPDFMHFIWPHHGRKLSFNQEK